MSKFSKEQIDAYEQERNELEILTNLLVKWILQPESRHRHDQVLAVLNGGTIFAQDEQRFVWHSNRLVRRIATNKVLGEPKISKTWKEIYQTQLTLPPERKHELVCFILYYNTLFSIILALSSLSLPLYVLLEVIDWIPNVEHASRFCKVKLLENVYSSSARILNSKRLASRYYFRFSDNLSLKYAEQRKILNCLIVLKGNYIGHVDMHAKRPSGGLVPHIGGKHLVGMNYPFTFGEWLLTVQNYSFLKDNFEYYVSTILL